MAGLALASALFYRLITWQDPGPGRIGMFTGPDVPNSSGIDIIEYLHLYFSPLTPGEWLLFLVGVAVAVFLIIGIPQLLDRYGGDNRK